MSTVSDSSKSGDLVSNDAQSTTQPTDANKLGIMKSGRVWKETKKPLRVNALGMGKKSWERKKEERLSLQAFKAKSAELKQEKEDERKQKANERKERQKQREEKERYDMLAKKMHAKVCYNCFYSQVFTISKRIVLTHVCNFLLLHLETRAFTKKGKTKQDAQGTMNICVLNSTNPIIYTIYLFHYFSLLFITAFQSIRVLITKLHVTTCDACNLPVK